MQVRLILGGCLNTLEYNRTEIRILNVIGTIFN